MNANVGSLCLGRRTFRSVLGYDGDHLSSSFQRYRCLFVCRSPQVNPVHLFEREPERRNVEIPLIHISISMRHQTDTGGAEIVSS